MYDGSSYSAELVGYDESNDIAVLKINAQGLAYATLGDSDSVHVGDSVVAIGNPLGELTFSLVQAVSDGSPAASAGVLAGDVIISVDGMNLDCDAFVDRIASSASGESLTLGIYRQGQALEITLTVGEQIQSQAPQVSTAPALSEDPELLPRNRKSGTVPSGKAH